MKMWQMSWSTKTLVEYAMSKKLKYQSEIAGAIHVTVAGMYKHGTVNDVTMREFDVAFLAVPPIAPKEIKKLRRRHKLSQPVFARYLNTSESTVEKWETGAKKPSGMARKLLSVVEKHGLEMLA
jgi:putative transcriptional regulator